MEGARRVSGRQVTCEALEHDSRVAANLEVPRRIVVAAEKSGAAGKAPAPQVADSEPSRSEEAGHC